MLFVRKFIFLISLLILLNLTIACNADKSSADQPVNKKPNSFFPHDRYDFKSALEGEEVVHDFIVQNKGTAPLVIEKVKTG